MLILTPKPVPRTRRPAESGPAQTESIRPRSRRGNKGWGRRRPPRRARGPLPKPATVSGSGSGAKPGSLPAQGLSPPVTALPGPLRAATDTGGPVGPGACERRGQTLLWPPARCGVGGASPCPSPHPGDSAGSGDGARRGSLSRVGSPSQVAGAGSASPTRSPGQRRAGKPGGRRTRRPERSGPEQPPLPTSSPGDEGRSDCPRPPRRPWGPGRRRS